MTDILKRIADAAAERLERESRILPTAELKAACMDTPARAGFAAAFRTEGIHIIAELKQASPSKGIIRPDFQTELLAEELAEAGAAALSVLTEPAFFLGSLARLKQAAQTTSLPLLRKDFLLDVRQIYEAKLYGASAVLLIAALLEPGKLAELAAAARECGLDVLGEAHTEEELAALLAAPVDLIGVNARDLKDFHCSLSRAEALISRIPPDRVAIAESAIGSHSDIVRLAKAGARGFLVGETLMRSAHPGETLKGLLS